MPEFQYVSKDISGKTFNGVLEADNIESFYRTLRSHGQFCVSVHETGLQQKEIRFGSKKIKLKDLSIFCRQFSTMLNSGLSVIKCLDILYQQTTKKNIKAIVLGVYEAVQRGESLSKAMALQDAFPELLLNMVAAGEASGTLDTVMNRMATQYEKDNKLQNKVKQAMVYPIFLVCMSVAVVIFLLTFIMPTFLKMFDQFGGKIPTTTKILLSISNAMTGYWYLFIIGVIAVYFAWVLLMRNEKTRMGWDRMKLRFPIFGKILLTLESARFARTLASLFSSGLPIIQSIEIVTRVIKNTYVKAGLLQATEDVRRGVSISGSIRKLEIFPVMLCSMLNIGEESGNMDEILNKTAAFYDDEADTAIQQMVSLIEPIMIVVLALIVGFIIVSIITPIYSVYGSIGSTS
ncbi:type II secretion system F family protein [Ethanoligenens harbinense]|uniref:Type II secretion system F domain n=1 Tax=Ethanoligenens harbinense (strain DSM 18485 / JCM 12961 / CGMCC 1.5033 / YUAN-3) TaxID=663278 RepID=E6U304_ETHHY|nr:type II secretion system F family protein [Ethanoligenens harbinense]ADU26371.1 Type II secretion system F domain [Ethanoligenens harbinense YUAN-3]AVQ95500.1 type II secretion system F family protein [Ethanoligenens harbinense YUAN-3]AYF38164.1 type II secretion system F family protein [Ethanoligenens harbinense]AYF40909.1 type II secretion system F family protein [Ethanoligenens harbinense]QCN91741.1 type II secretion system F family protein [Ethanoligenens harbinense]